MDSLLQFTLQELLYIKDNFLELFTVIAIVGCLGRIVDVIL